jgi:lysozyme
MNTQRELTILSILKGQLKRHEGLRLKPYLCTAGKLTIGYGRNLDDKGINENEADILLDNDMNDALNEAQQVIHNFEDLSVLRQVVIVNMIFNLGVNKYKAFKNTIEAINSNDFRKAANEMRDSNWYRQVGKRAEELCELMANG